MGKRHINFYKDYYVSPDILAHSPTKPVRWHANRTGKSPYKGYNKAFIKQQYEALNLHYFGSKKEFKDFFRKSKRTEADIERYWQEYLSRDALVASGEYSSIRAEKYADTYLNKLRETIATTGGTRELRIVEKTLSSVNKQQLGDLLASNTLPDLTRMYYGSTDEILPFEGEGSFDDIIDMFKQQNISIKDPTYHGLKGINYLEDDDALELIDNAIEVNKLHLRVTKTGKRYIPFVPKRYQQKALRIYYSYNRDEE